MLKSDINNEPYIGSTNDLKRRVIEHNDGKVFSTKRYRPWTLIYYEAFISEKIARLREKRLKYNGNAKHELMKRLSLVKSGAGFTLIELLVTIGVLSILATGLMIVVNPIAQIQKANDTKRKSDLAQIQKGLETYYNDYGQYPFIYAAGDYRLTNPDYSLADWGSVWGSSANPYMRNLPKDPSSSKKYIYFSPAGHQSYYLYASLDRTNDPQVCSQSPCTGSNGKTGAPNLTTACGGPCSFGVTSTNTSP